MTKPVDLTYSPLTAAARSAFRFLCWLSPWHWLGLRFSLFRSRHQLTAGETASPKFVKARSRAVEYYLMAWILVELTAAAVVSFAQPNSNLRTLVCVLAAIRIVEVIQVTANAALFDAIGRPWGNRVASPVRMVVLAAFNFVELCLCFGVVYAANLTRLHGAGRGLTAFYFSIATQLTIGYGDVYPMGWLRAVAAVQGLLATLFVLLVFGRFVASLSGVEGVLDKK